MAQEKSLTAKLDDGVKHETNLSNKVKMCPILPVLYKLNSTVNLIVPIDNPTVTSLVQSSASFETHHMQPTQVNFVYLFIYLLEKQAYKFDNSIQYIEYRNINRYKVM